MRELPEGRAFWNKTSRCLILKQSNTEHLSFSFCLPAKNYSSKLSQVLYVASVFWNFTFQPMPCLQEFRSVFQFHFLFSCVSNAEVPGVKMFSSASAQHCQTLHPQSSKHRWFPGEQYQLLSKQQHVLLCTPVHTSWDWPHWNKQRPVPSSFGNHTSAVPVTVIKICSWFFLGRNWFLNTLAPVTKTNALLHAAKHSQGLWVQHQQLPCAAALAVGLSTSYRLSTNCSWNFIERHFCAHLLPSHLSWSLPTAQNRNVQVCVIPRNFPWDVYIWTQISL